jgi:hypothetical protein
MAKIKVGKGTVFGSRGSCTGQNHIDGRKYQMGVAGNYKGQKILFNGSLKQSKK